LVVAVSVLDDPFSFDYSEELLEVPSEVSLAGVAALATEQRAAEAEVARLEAALELARRRLEAVSCDLLPRAMAAIPPAGLTAFTLGDGWRVSVGDDYQCGQADDAPDDGKRKRRTLEQRLATLACLEARGAGDLARRTVTAALGPADATRAAAVVEALRRLPFANAIAIDVRRVVPAPTLAKYAREQAAAGEDPPLDVLGVTVRRRAKIVEPKR
jgi:hypothetical protein